MKMKEDVSNDEYKESIEKIARRIIIGNNPLTEDFLKEKGFFHIGDSLWTQKNLKERDLIWVQLCGNYYRIFHGPQKTFISLESSKEWFELYYMMIIDEHKFYEMSGI